MSHAAVQKIHALKAAPDVTLPSNTNPAHFQHLQFTIDGLLCDEECRPDDEVDGARDICVSGDEDKECVKVASINSMRQIVQDARDDSTADFGTLTAMMDTLMTEYAPLEVHNQDVLDKRSDYNTKVAKIRDLISKLRGIITTLEEQAEQVDDLKKKLMELKEMIAELKKNFVKSDADCSGLVG